MITEDYVSFELSKLLKEKGFDNECSGYYNQERVLQRLSTCSIKDTLRSPFYFDCMPAPTLQMAMKWLREVHNLDIIAPPQFDNSEWAYSSIIFKLSIPCTEIRLNDNKDKKEDACEEAIKYCLENLI